MAPLNRVLVAGIGAAGLAQAAPLNRHDNGDVVSKWVAQSNQTITWGPCPDRFPSTFTCATFHVPLDWSQAGNNKHDTIELGMIRREADDKANRIGYLFANPGGPGVQATDLVAGSADSFDPEIRARFDIVGLDPRGVGLSTPLRCDPQLYNKRVKYMPKTEEEYNALSQYNKDLGASCLQMNGPIVNFVDTISAVKDHEAVRIALGEKASYLGLSYGTQLFGQYAQFYPDSFRAIILDGNLQHSQSESTNSLVEGTTYEATLKQLFAWCASSEECALHNDDIEAVFVRVTDKLSAAPIPAPGCDDKVCRSDLSLEDLLFSVQEYLASLSAWPVFAEALSEADHGNATIFSSVIGLAGASDVYTDSLLYAGTAIGCQDWTHASTQLADLIEKQRLGAVFMPLTFGASQSFKLQVQCIDWPANLSDPPTPISYKGKTKILMLNSLYDPETSYTWALGLHSEMENTVLVTRNGSGHTSYLNNGEMTQIGTAYLVNLTLPEPGTITQS
ncbi:TAP-like protein-domain-containing protein [Xylaria nigripes]|nr:TAP-like protein-domain-containing protein [Xylaria nigripes]